MTGPPVDVRPPVELDLGSAGRFAYELSQAFATGAGVVTVDFGDVLFCDSSGLRVLVQAAKLAAARGSVLAIRNPTRQLLLIASIVGASDLLDLPQPD